MAADVLRQGVELAVYVAKALHLDGNDVFVGRKARIECFGVIQVVLAILKWVVRYIRMLLQAVGYFDSKVAYLAKLLVLQGVSKVIGTLNMFKPAGMTQIISTHLCSVQNIFKWIIKKLWNVMFWKQLIERLEPSRAQPSWRYNSDVIEHAFLIDLYLWLLLSIAQTLT